MVHNYIPSPVIGKLEADYDTLHLATPASAIQPGRAAESDNARLESHDLGGELLPTLHPIVSRRSAPPAPPPPPPHPGDDGSNSEGITRCGRSFKYAPT